MEQALQQFGMSFSADNAFGIALLMAVAVLGALRGGDGDGGGDGGGD